MKRRADLQGRTRLRVQYVSYLTCWNAQVNPKREDCLNEEHDDVSTHSILRVRWQRFHTAKFHPPTSFSFWVENFEPTRSASPLPGYPVIGRQWPVVGTMFVLLETCRTRDLLRSYRWIAHRRAEAKLGPLSRVRGRTALRDVLLARRPLLMAKQTRLCQLACG